MKLVFNFKKIGKKVKTLAIVIMIIGIVISVVLGIIYIGLGISLGRFGSPLILIGALVAIIGPILAWISSWSQYCLGEAADKSSEAVEEIKELKKLLEKNNGGNFGAELFDTAESKPVSEEKTADDVEKNND